MGCKIGYIMDEEKEICVKCSIFSEGVRTCVTSASANQTPWANGARYYSCYSGYYLKNSWISDTNSCLREDVDNNDSTVEIGNMLKSEPTYKTIEHETAQVRMWNQMEPFNITYALRGWQLFETSEPLLPSHSIDYKIFDF